MTPRQLKSLKLAIVGCTLFLTSTVAFYSGHPFDGSLLMLGSLIAFESSNWFKE